MKKITQRDYDKFYDDVMDYFREGVAPFDTSVSYCNPPDPCEIIKKYEIERDTYPMSPMEERKLIGEISLSEREYGRFIDENYKLVFIRAMSNADEDEIDQLKKEIAYAIQENDNNRYGPFGF